MGDHKKTWFLCGIGGSGMSALATLLRESGGAVRGSDRSRDKGDTPEKFAALARAGAALFPQDGSGVDSAVDCLVVSSAVEESVPDVRAARALGIDIRKRADILADMVNAARGICVGGTSGKTTVTGMIAHMLTATGHDPSVMCGGAIRDFPKTGENGNARIGAGDLFVAETDESDGSIALFRPAIAVLNNVTLDHKPLAELRTLFAEFLSRAREAAVVNLDDPEAAALAGIHPRTVTFAIDSRAASLTALDLHEDRFTLIESDSGRQIPLRLMVPGRHNVMNALAALAAAKALDIDLPSAARALESFHGIKRRFEIVGTAAGVTVIDDFAHNPDKIAATLRTLKMCDARVIAIFQPHGFGPTRLMKDGLIEVFTRELAPQDILVMPEIYYAGGTAQKSISARDIVDAVNACGRRAYFFENRASIIDFLARTAESGDRVVVMGARDDTLPDFAAGILRVIAKKAA